ncbi:MAG TPA: exosortase/archaeosortase family protein [Verrucomicrobiae bacterium]|nr:exosortase/archaeosortase family protein [Verrucomicrobiae bacterium]
MLSRLSANPWWFLAGWVLVSSLLFGKPLFALAEYGLANDNASHVLMIPLIVAWLLYLDHKKVQHTSFHIAPAAVLAVCAGLIAVTTHYYLSGNHALPFLVFSVVCLWLAGFLAVFGVPPLRSVWFDLAFLVFLIPIPDRFLDRVVYFLQAGSADMAGFVFDLTDVPALREGFVFRLPRLSIEVAPECSGIRSSIALFILALLVCHFSFSKFWKKVVFLMAGLLMMIVKNGVRIATLAILANYVNPAFLYGRLHRQGGVVFFLLGLSLLIPVYWVLRRGEKTLALHPNEVSTSTL